MTMTTTDKDARIESLERTINNDLLPCIARTGNKLNDAKARIAELEQEKEQAFEAGMRKSLEMLSEFGTDQITIYPENDELHWDHVHWLTRIGKGVGADSLIEHMRKLKQEAMY